MDKVSIIVPIYGIEQFISQCIESLLNQTYLNLEIILVDDGSKDRSGEICDEYAEKDSRIVVYHKQNGGLTSARNYGLDRASGDWIMHVDGDDWIDTSTLERLLEKAAKTNADIVFSDFWFEYPDKQEQSHFYDWSKQGVDGLKEYISTSWTCLAGSIQKRSLYINNNLRSPERINFCEDFHLIVRLCYFAKNIVKVGQPLYHYRQHNSSMIHNNSKKNGIDERRVYADIIDFFKQQGVYNEFKECMAWRTLNASEDLALSTNYLTEFYDFNPDKKDFIFSCPKIGIKLKIIMWCLTHGLQSVAINIINVRKLLRR